ncbi:MAG TPA: UDP-N-acetylglucosamine 2-epimerase (non-hydrolyzing) [Pseudonocardiaceae bacterium]|nr:UDP-N-acetylglucosamine 2-epimerase (non-hydrolyzing) [Pseudonocardiaceae bacterium]
MGGTRPEALKLGPVAAAMRELGRLRPVIVASGQHPSMFHQALSVFGLEPDVTVDLARDGGGQAELAGRLLPELDALLGRLEPAAVVVQGDTATTLAGALTAFWRRIPVAHLEAGLRSGNLDAPFPEEGNRRLVAQIAALHLTPTPAAQRNLAEEGVAGQEVITIGNTIVDAAIAASSCRSGFADERVSALIERTATLQNRLVLATLHRRESWGEPMRQVLAAVADIVRSVPDVEVVLPAHPNPALRDEVRRALGGLERVLVTGPLQYVDLLRVLKCATLVLSDSGGIQEEVASFGVPILVLREVTERMEAVESGFATLVGTDPDAIRTTALALLNGDPGHPAPRGCNPFGDGRARYRAEQAVAWLLGHQLDPPAPFVPTPPESPALTVVAS